MHFAYFTQYRSVNLMCMCWELACVLSNSNTHCQSSNTFFHNWMKTAWINDVVVSRWSALAKLFQACHCFVFSLLYFLLYSPWLHVLDGLCCSHYAKEEWMKSPGMKSLSKRAYRVGRNLQRGMTNEVLQSVSSHTVFGILRTPTPSGENSPHILAWFTRAL